MEGDGRKARNRGSMSCLQLNLGYVQLCSRAKASSRTDQHFWVKDVPTELLRAELLVPASSSVMANTGYAEGGRIPSAT